MPVAIKICGICNLADAEKCVELGVDYLGLIFADSKRQIQTAEARQIRKRLKNQVQFVGVFRNQDMRFVNDTADTLGLDFVQLHGDETPDYCRQITHPVIKAFELLPGADCGLDSIKDKYSVHAHLFDRPKALSQDGSWLGQVADLYGRELQQFQPFFLAGGLEAANVGVACALNPFAVDVASGVEAEPGKKDYAKLQAFFEAVRTNESNSRRHTDEETKQATQS